MKGTTFSISTQMPETLDQAGYEALEYKQVDCNGVMEDSMNQNTIQTDATIALSGRIQAAAIKCDTMHVFVNYSPHVGWLSVTVHPADSEYSLDVGQWPDTLVDERVDVKRSDAHKALMVVVDKLQRLGVEV